MKIQRLIFIACLAFLFFISCGNKENKKRLLHDAEVAMGERPPPPITESNDIVVDAENESYNSPQNVKEDLSGRIQVITEEEFIAKITDIDNIKGFQYKGQTPCIVDFYADWCRPCAYLAPILDSIATEYKGRVIVYKVNVDRAGSITKQLDINKIPALYFFKRNAQPAMIVGVPSKEELTKVIQEILLK